MDNKPDGRMSTLIAPNEENLDTSMITNEEDASRYNRHQIGLIHDTMIENKVGVNK